MQHDGTVGTGGGRRVLDLAGGEHEHTHTQNANAVVRASAHTHASWRTTPGDFFTPQRAALSDAFSGR